MPILPPPQKRLRDLIEALDSPEPARRASAEARLNLLGLRALAGLLEWLPRSSRDGRLAALRILEGIDTGAARGAVRELSADPDSDVAAAAAGLCARDPEATDALGRALDRGPESVRHAAALALQRLATDGHAAALDRLAALAADASATARLRAVAVETLPASAEPRGLLRRLAGLPRRRKAAASDGTGPEARPSGDWEALLAAQPSAGALRRCVARLGRLAPPDRIALIAALADAIPPGPGLAAAARSLEDSESPAVIPVLRRLLARLPPAPRSSARDAQTAAVVHAVLASVPSRIALHDLRDRLSEGPVSLPLVEVARSGGDASVLGPLARLARRAPEASEPCRSAVAAIVEREGSRRCVAARRRLAAADRASLEALWPTTRPRRSRRR